MKRRSRAGGRPIKTRPRKTPEPNRRHAPKTVGRSTSSTPEQGTEIARLARELSDALEQQTATSQVLQVISSSPGDLQPVLAAMLENAVRICDAKFGNIYRWDGEALHMLASHNTPPAFAEDRRRSPYRPYPNSPIGRMVADKTLVHIRDVRAEDVYTKELDPAAVTAVTLGGTRTVLGVPLLNKGEMIGAFFLSRQEVRPFSAKQIELVENFAAQAAIAIENARLLNELRQRTTDLTEALEQQTATAEVLQTISSSPGDLAPVFAAMLEKAVRICDANFGVLVLHEGGTVFRPVAMHNAPPEFVELRRREPTFQAGLLSPLSRVVASKHLLQITDLTEDVAYNTGDPSVVQFADVTGVRTLLLVPMLKDAEAIGVAVVYRREVRPFTDKQIELVKNFAAQAVIAIENARLLNELRDSLHQQTATADVLKIISRSTFDPQVVLNTLVESAARLCEADMSAAQSLKGPAYEHTAAFGLTPEQHEQIKTIKFEPGRGTITGRILLTGNVVHVHDLRNDPEYTLSTVIESLGARTIVGVPLLREGMPIGVFVLMRRSVRPFTEKQIELLSTYGDQAVIAIENVRLLNELRQRTTDLTEALEQQTATSDVLKVISRSAFDLQAVLETLVQAVARLCLADKSVIMQRDGDVFRTVAFFGFPPELVQWSAEHPLPGDRASATGRAALEGRAIHIPDVLADPEYGASGHQQAAGHRTTLAVPLLREGTTIGVFGLLRNEVNPFTEKQIELVQSFAAQAVIAIENARLLNELRQRTDDLTQRTADLTEALEQQTATSKVLEVISRSAFDLHAVFETVAASSVRLCGADRGFIFRFDGELLRMEVAFNASREFMEFVAQNPILPGRDSASGRAALERRTIHIPNVLLIRNIPMERKISTMSGQFSGCRYSRVMSYWAL